MNKAGIAALVCFLMSMGFNGVYAQKAHTATAPAFQFPKHDTITEADYYDFFNTTVNPFPVTTMGGPCNPDTLKICNLSNLPEMGVLTDDTTEIFHDTIFSMADRKYIRMQMTWVKDVRWQDGKIQGVKVIDGNKVHRLIDSLGTDSGWHVYYKLYHIGFNKFSVPLYSLDKTKCIVFRSFECGGSFGLGNTNAFVKRKDKWVLAKSCGPWVH